MKLIPIYKLFNDPERPWWVVKNECEYDLNWFEEGRYTFKCGGCYEKVWVELPEIDNFRLFATCPKCNEENWI